MPLRAGAYCRVSTDREDQASSLMSQKTYFETYINAHQGWRLVEIYADEGISGTSTRRREQFNRMIADAIDGRLDVILTKEVSRFARNTVDTLEYTRLLKRYGVRVIFLSDNIDTGDNDGELRLTIMASMAQEESRKTSQRVKWGQKRRMEAGVVFGNNSLYGFDLTGGRLTVKEDEAQVVRHIYHKFLGEGKGTHVIARELYEEGVPPPRSATGRWSCVMVRRVLRNEKYAGDLCQKKFVTPDYLTHKKVENHGQEDQILLRDHHRAIIDRPTWEAVQAELARRAQAQGGGSKYSNRYWCSGKIRCGACGSRFVPRVTQRRGGVYKLWGCLSRVRYGRRKEESGDAGGCDMRMLNHKALTACVRFVLQQLELDFDAIARELAADIQRVLSDSSSDTETARLSARLEDLERRRERVMDAYFAGDITREDMARMKAKYDGELGRLAARLAAQADRAHAQREQTESLEALTETIRESAAHSEEVFAEVVEEVTVFSDHIAIKLRHLSVTFRLWYTTHGAGDSYTTDIERWETV